MEKAMTALFILVAGIILGYGWRMHHEIENWDRWMRQAKIEALYQLITETEANKIMVVGKITAVKRADGSVVVKKQSTEKWKGTSQR